jgi:cytochrome c-type biogenesis protein CcmH/NrfF
VLARINTRMSFLDVMSTELLPPELEFESQDSEEEDRVMKNIQQEIECPRCSDIMTLSSDFDALLYFCQECQLSLVMK